MLRKRCCSMIAFYDHGVEEDFGIVSRISQLFCEFLYREGILIVIVIESEPCLLWYFLFDEHMMLYCCEVVMARMRVFVSLAKVDDRMMGSVDISDHRICLVDRGEHRGLCPAGPNHDSCLLFSAVGLSQSIS